jgi:dihydrofolate reductase
MVKAVEDLKDPYPGSSAIIMTRDTSYSHGGISVAHSVHQAIELAGKISSEVFVIGGAEIYELFLPKANKIYLTEIEQEIAGDAYFPNFDLSEFNLITSNKRQVEFSDTSFTYSFNVYSR